MTETKTTATAKTRSRAKPAGAAAAAKTATATAKAKPAAKPAAAKPAAKVAAKPAARVAAKPRTAAVKASKPAEPSVGEAAAALVGAVGEALSIRKKELVERVVSASGAKKKQVKDIVEHTLKVLGDALAKGEELNIPPFGKAKVNRARADDKGNTMMVKVKQGNAARGNRKGAKQGLAAADE